MPICTPCAEAADAEVKALATDGRVPEGHSPEICRDRGRTAEDIALHGTSCPCQHRPVGTATRKDAP